MNDKFASFSFASLLFVAGLALDCEAASPLYRVTEIGTFGGSTSVGFAINANGDVVGRARAATGARHAFLFAGGVLSDLGTLGGTESSGNGINNAGVIAGWLMSWGRASHGPFDMPAR